MIQGNSYWCYQKTRLPAVVNRSGGVCSSPVFITQQLFREVASRFLQEFPNEVVIPGRIKSKALFLTQIHLPRGGLIYSPSGMLPDLILFTHFAGGFRSSQKSVHGQRIRSIVRHTRHPGGRNVRHPLGPRTPNHCGREGNPCERSARQEVGKTILHKIPRDNRASQHPNTVGTPGIVCRHLYAWRYRSASRIG
mgnify:CR=1 FL=1